MSKKMLLLGLLIIFIVSILITGTAFSKTVNRSTIIIATLKNDANIETSKNEVLKIIHVKKIDVTYRDKEWSKYVNKYDLPNMENPFKNELIIKVDKQQNLEKVYKEVQKENFVESLKYSSDKTLMQKITFWK